MNDPRAHGPRTPTNCGAPAHWLAGAQSPANPDEGAEQQQQQQQQHKRGSAGEPARPPDRRQAAKTRHRTVIRKFQKLDLTALSSTPAPDVKIGQRVAYKEYYGNEFGTIRWIGRVPQISPDWTAGVEFDNAIGEGDGSLNGRRYFIAKDCFAKFLPLEAVVLVDQHVGRPEPGTMISVMSAAVRPGQMISIQRVSTVHVQHCFLNAPHHRPGADILAVNTRLHCQCPNCGPCAHVVKPPRTQRLRSGKNATHMCQFSTYTCCGMESSDEALCTYTGNKVSSMAPTAAGAGLPPLANSWIEGSGYLSNLQAQQSKLMPEEYRLGAGPEAIFLNSSRSSSRHANGKRHHRHNDNNNDKHDSPANRHQVAATGSDQHHQAPRRHQHHRHKKAPLVVDTVSCANGSPIYTNLNDTSDKIDHCTLGSCCHNLDDDNNITHQHLTSLVCSAIVSEHNAHPDATRDDDKLALGNANKVGLAPDAAKEIYAKINHNSTIAAAAPAPPPPPPPPTTTTTTTMSLRDVNATNSGDARQKLKTAKVLYRDSIENRYLFPTDDDAIDSTLEADLENLSQARYGHCARARLNGSRNIFKSLRSLLSCLSAKSNQNDFERRSDNTLRFFEHPTNEINKSQPITRQIPSRCSSACCGCTATTNSNDSNNNIKRIRPYEFPLVKHSSSSLEMGKFGVGGEFRSTTTTPLAPIPATNLAKKKGSCGDSSTNGLGNGIYAGFTTATTTTTTTTTMEQVRRQISSSSDCGFSSASQNSINFHSQPSCSPIGSLEDEQQRINQIYKRIVARLISSTSAITNEDLFKLKKALFEIHSDNCCLHHSSQVVNQTLENSDCDQTIADIIKKSFLSSNGVVVSGDSGIMQNSCGHEQIHQTSSPTCCQQSSQTKWKYLNDIDTVNNRLDDQHHQIVVLNERRTLSERQVRMMIDGSQAPASGLMETHHINQIGSNKNHVVLKPFGSALCTNVKDTSAKEHNRSTALSPESVKITSDDKPNNSSSTTTTTTNLPKAFELKLTLSINSDEKLPTPSVNEISSDQSNNSKNNNNQDNSSAQQSSNIHSSGSNLNISIVSSGTEEDTVDKVKTMVSKDKFVNDQFEQRDFSTYGKQLAPISMNGGTLDGQHNSRK